MNFSYSIFDRNSFYDFIVFKKCVYYLFVDCTESSLLLIGFLLLRQDGATLLQCMGFFLQYLLLLWSKGSRHADFLNCGSWHQ